MKLGLKVDKYYLFQICEIGGAMPLCRAGAGGDMHFYHFQGCMTSANTIYVIVVLNAGNLMSRYFSMRKVV